MRIRTLLFALGVCLVCVTTALAELTSGNSEAIGADFQGTVKTMINDDGSQPYGYSKWEKCSGQWINESGVVFNGKTDLFVGNGIKLDLRKMGKLITPMFEGTIKYEELLRPDSDIANRMEVLNGRELLPEGGVFDGETTIYQDREENGSKLKDKKGKIVTPSFQGELQQEISMRNNGEEIDGLVTNLIGRELLADGGFFEGEKKIQYKKQEGYIIHKEGKLVTSTFNGTIKLDEYNDYQSKQSNSVETLAGVWTIAPELKYEGSIVIQNHNGEVNVQDNRNKI